jgi:ADP-ribose pyrophosphatase
MSRESNRVLDSAVIALLFRILHSSAPWRWEILDAYGEMWFYIDKFSWNFKKLMAKRFTSWKTLLSEEIFNTPWMSIFHRLFELPDGKRGNYFFLHTRGSAMTIPVADNGKIILVNQYRYLMDGASLEIPCGGIKDGQSEENAARAELVEETGYECKTLKKIGKFVPYNGLSDEYCTVFIARNLIRVVARPDETEQIELVFHSPEEIDRLIQKNKIIDGMSIAGWFLARPHLR